MSECTFCKITAGELPNHTVYEDSHALAFLDITPHAKGHTVVVPKVHAATLFDFNEQLTHNFLFAVKRAMEIIDATLHPDGYNVGWNHGEAGGQAVHHLHVHIMPRWENDGGTNMHGIINNPGEMTVEEVAKSFSK